MWSQHCTLWGLNPSSLSRGLWESCSRLMTSPIFPQALLIWALVDHMVFCGVWNRAAFSKSSLPCEAVPFLVFWVEGASFSGDFFFLFLFISWQPPSSAPSLRFMIQTNTQTSPLLNPVKSHLCSSSVPTDPSQSAFSSPLSVFLCFIQNVWISLAFTRKNRGKYIYAIFPDVAVLCTLYFNKPLSGGANNTALHVYDH